MKNKQTELSGHGAGGWITEHRNKVVVLGILAALVLIWWWLTMRPYSTTSLPIVECRQLYRSARTAADTMQVDDVRPAQQPRGRSGIVTCGILRLEGALAEGG